MEGEPSKGERKRSVFYTAASGAKGGPPVPNPSHEATDFSEFCAFRNTGSGGRIESPDLELLGAHNV